MNEIAICPFKNLTLFDLDLNPKSCIIKVKESQRQTNELLLILEDW